jgi:hypothetical protein
MRQQLRDVDELSDRTNPNAAHSRLNSISFSLQTSFISDEDSCSIFKQLRFLPSAEWNVKMRRNQATARFPGTDD